MVAGQFMHLDRSSYEAPPCRRATVENAVQVALLVHYLEIEQIHVDLSRHILACQRKMIDHYRAQVIDELRVVSDDLLKQRDGVWIVGLHHNCGQLLQSLWHVLVERMGIEETHPRPYLFGLIAWTGLLTAGEDVAVDHCQHLYLQPPSMHLLDNGVADQATQRTADQSIGTIGLDTPNFFQIIGSDLFNAGRQLLATAQPARLQTVNRHGRIEVPQQTGEAQAKAGHRMNAEQWAMSILASRPQRQHHPDRIRALTAEPLDQNGKIRNRGSFKDAAKWQLYLQVLGQEGGHHRCGQRIAAQLEEIVMQPHPFHIQNLLP